MEKTGRFYEADFAGHPVRYAFRCPKTKRYFLHYIRRSEPGPADIEVSAEYLDRQRTYIPEETDDGYIEYRGLIGPTSKVLLAYHRCVFHCVSFIFRGTAWLLSAPSGGGKTTQYQNWQRLYPAEIMMVSGDMPVLRLDEDGRISVHPSPWNGKERIRGSMSAPLGGVVYLEKGSGNILEPFPPETSLIPLIQQFMVLPDTEEEIRSLTSILDAMLSGYPVYKFVNRGDDASTALLREQILTVTGK